MGSYGGFVSYQIFFVSHSSSSDPIESFRTVLSCTVESRYNVIQGAPENVCVRKVRCIGTEDFPLHEMDVEKCSL